MDLRFTDTNSSDDTAGRAFGLDGNLYLPVVVTGVGGLGLFGLLGLVIRFPLTVAGVVAMVPCALTLLWVLLLRRGKPAGYDRDKLEDLIGSGHFGPVAGTQQEVAP
ncbi:MAG: hypothetical protein PHQ04_04050 [Opitutaceae bacterium]|nr:hypothetical protein [Opitutaceae bacterium]